MLVHLLSKAERQQWSSIWEQLGHRSQRTFRYFTLLSYTRTKKSFRYLGVWINGNIQPSNHQAKQDRQCTYNLTLRQVRETIAALEKQQILNYSECASVVLVIQHAKRIRRSMLSSVPLWLQNTAPNAITFTFSFTITTTTTNNNNKLYNNVIIIRYY